MDALEVGFQRMGARVKVTSLPAPDATGRHWNGVPRWERVAEPIRVDVVRDSRGEYFDVRHRRDAEVTVVDVQAADRHLLLAVRGPGWNGTGWNESRFLCGRDERSWFVAATPEAADAMDVQAAKDALKPQEVWDSIRKFGVPPEDRDLRHTAAFVRQGEWFFIPRLGLEVPEERVLRSEPIRRGGGKPHLCEFLYRDGGETVYVSAAHPNGLTVLQYRNLPKVERRSQSWTQMSRDPKAYVRGWVQHTDHETIRLDPWHQVVMNTETQSRAMRHVAFLD